MLLECYQRHYFLKNKSELNKPAKEGMASPLDAGKRKDLVSACVETIRLGSDCISEALREDIMCNECMCTLQLMELILKWLPLNAKLLPELLTLSAKLAQEAEQHCHQHRTPAYKIFSSQCRLWKELVRETMAEE
jgi:hypothetical protein